MAYRQQPSFDGSSHQLTPQGSPYQDAYDKEGPSRARGGAGGYQQPYSQGYQENDYGYAPPKKGRSKWLTIGLPVLLLAIIAAVVGGVLGSRASKNNDNAVVGAGSNSAASSGAGASGTARATATDPGTAAASSAAVNGLARVATGTDTYLLPMYPTTTNSAVYVAPTTSARANHTWPTDPDSPSAASPRAHPRLIAPDYKWQALPALIQHDAYLASWNATIFANATRDAAADPVTYDVDGCLSCSGVLDVARIFKARIKNWAYAWRMTKDTKWLDRAWVELNVVMGGDPNVPFGTDATRWNAVHFLDLAEFTAGVAIAYDWMHDGWTDAQRTTIRNAIVTNGLDFCQASLSGASSAGAFSWWTGVNGNWNCVCNSGCTLGALAIQGEDTSGQAAAVLALSVTNAKANCARAVHVDGTWSETPNYWYFGTTGFAEMTSSLITATGTDQGMLAANANFNLTGLYHMYVFGMTSLFDYADHGPNKYSATANAMMFMGSSAGYGISQYNLYQRDRYDASEPWSMFWYEPAAIGAWWDGLALDRHFNSGSDDWVSMRSSWTNNDGLYVAMKAGNMTDHQTHGDLDAGDFVIDAMGQRWAGELGSGNYLSTEYFSSEAQNAARWTYYRKRTEGQNTILLNYENQNVLAQPTTSFGSSGDAQGSSTVMTLGAGSTAFYTMDLTNSYNGTSIRRGVRMLNQRKQVLIQDDIEAPGATNIQWRMHTNATVSVSSDGKTATLTLAGKTMQVVIASPATGASFTTQEAVRLSQSPAMPAQPTYNGVLELGDQPNPGVTVLTIVVPAGSNSLQVLFNPQWPGASASDFVTPPNVPVSSWSTTSHN